MREPRDGAGQPAKDDKAREGLQHDREGRETGDAAFHEQGWGFTPEKERTTLEANAERVVDLEEKQVQDIAGNDPELGIKAFKQLLTRHPDDARAPDWLSAVKRLTRKR